MSNKKLANALGVEDKEIEEVYKAMCKISEVDKQINCRACGFNTCEQMVAAIVLGTKSKKDCACYMEIRVMMARLDRERTKITTLIGDIKKVMEILLKLSRSLGENAMEIDKIQGQIEFNYGEASN